MIVNVLEAKRLVQVWLTNAERESQEILNSLKPMYQRNQAQGFMTVVYKSGKHDLQQDIRALLLYNKRKLAELEVQQEKQLQCARNV